VDKVVRRGREEEATQPRRSSRDARSNNPEGSEIMRVSQGGREKRIFVFVTLPSVSDRIGFGKKG
jgi:hypothetical protein